MSAVETPTVGNFLNKCGYTDVSPFQVVRMTKSGKTAYVREVSCERDPSWKPEVAVGGFAGHTLNNREQKWIFGELTGKEVAVRLTKKGWKDKYGTRYSPNTKPIRWLPSMNGWLRKSPNAQAAAKSKRVGLP